MFSYPDFGWRWSLVLYRSDITADHILDHLDLDWDFSCLPIYGAKMDVQKLIEKTWEKNWNWRKLSKPDQKYVSDWFITDNKHFKWVRSTLIGKDNGNGWFISSIKEAEEKDWNWKHVSSVYGLDIDFVAAHPEHNWDMTEISSSEKVSMQYIKSHSSVLWDYSRLSKRTDLDMSLVEESPFELWDWAYLKSRDDLSEEVRHMSVGSLFSGSNWNKKARNDPID
ncbi:MAG: hypothetical protein K0U52_05465 [Gammaproteobacteria bacterium]|nr:hypothetical protein [Gammaproteobacteria bacterium]